MRTWLRWTLGFLSVAAGALLLASCDLADSELKVTTTADGADATPGDGVCEMTVGAGDCSLRAAVDEANASADVLLITVPTGTYDLTSAGTDNNNAGGDLDIAPASGSLSISASDTGAAVRGAGADGVFDVRSGRARLFNIGASDASGPGIAVRAGASVSVDHSSSHDNSGEGLRIAAGATASSENSTISTNQSGGVLANGDLTAAYTTITDNRGGGIRGTTKPLLLTSIVSDQETGKDCAGLVRSYGSNLDSDSTCFDRPTDLHASADLGPAVGLVPYHRPAGTSPVIDTVGPGPLCGPKAVDQRGEPRLSGAACDRGAVEVDLSNTFVVDSSGDTHDALPGDGQCTDLTGHCTLRAAIDETNALPDEHTIDLGVDAPLSLAGVNDDANTSGDLDIIRSVTIEGNGHAIDANLLDRAIDHRAGTLHLRDVTVRGGFNTSVQTHLSRSNGGGIRSLGSLDLLRVTLEGNYALGASAAYGGGVYATGLVEIVDSTLQDNHATAYGAGAVGSGGGLAILPGANARITGSQILGNAATGPIDGPADGVGGGIFVQQASLAIDDTVVATNSAGRLGGGTSATQAFIEVDRTRFTSNFAHNGGGLSLVDSHSTINSSTIESSNDGLSTDDETVFVGGGINFHGGSASIDASTVRFNLANYGAGVASDVPVDIVNSTFDNNFDYGFAFATAVYGPANITSTTIVGTGNLLSGAPITLSGSVLAAVDRSVCPGTNAGSPAPTSAGYNLVSDDTCKVTNVGDVQNVDALLGALAANGGPTLTHLPGAGSPARNAIPIGTAGLCDGTIATDQRGISRPQGTACDIGSVEQ